MGRGDQGFCVESPAAARTRAHAYVMVGAGHLHSWTVYAKVFISYYSKRPTDQFRGPNVVEAEEADKVAMEEIFSLCFSGHGTVAPVGALGDHS